jgi:hypothetical protein
LASIADALGVGFVAGNGGGGDESHNSPPFFDRARWRSKTKRPKSSSCGVCSTKAAQSGKRTPARSTPIYCFRPRRPYGRNATLAGKIAVLVYVNLHTKWADNSFGIAMKSRDRVVASRSLRLPRQRGAPLLERSLTRTSRLPLCSWIISLDSLCALSAFVAGPVCLKLFSQIRNSP